jgi:hypothetical protein
VAWTQADADALRVAIAKGEKSVTFSDRSVTYRDLDEMLQALALVERALQGTSARNFRLAAHSKGV